jgi:predicted ATPase
LADRARLSVDGIGALERGVNKAPQRETLALLLGALQLAPDQRQAIEIAAARASRPRANVRVATKHNLSRALTPLFGRERDLTALSHHIAASHVLTLTGAGGVGKTRLAVDAGRAALRQFPDGVWFVDLAPVGDAAGVAAAIATVFGVRERANQPLIEAVVAWLSRKRLLLILDNCEHIAGAAGTATERVVAGCLEVRILATSRQPLHVAGEQTYRVASLDSVASTSLFLDAARRADASFVLDPTDVPAIERICGHLDGIALAIELAAARVKFLSVAQLESLLAERFSVLTGEGRPARHQTMLAVLDWSYRLLTNEERTLFNRLGVFGADFSLEASVAICSGDGIAPSRMVELFGSLVDKSLVTSEPHGPKRRFRLLETMRAYALQKLGASVDTLRRRHAEYYVVLAEAAERGEYENFRQALVWSIDEGYDAALGIRLLNALREFLLSHGFSAESARRAERALQSDAALTPELEATAWELLSAMRGDLLMPESAGSYEAASHSLQRYERLGDLAGESRALRGRGVALMRLARFAEAEADLRRALELCELHGSPRDLVRTLGSLAVLYEVSGRPEEGRVANLRVLEMARAAGDERTVWITLMNLAEAEFALGQTASAAARLRELLAGKMSRQNVRLRANSEANLAAYLLALGREAEARAIARDAVFDAREAGDTGGLACALGHLAAMMAPQDPADAARLLSYVDDVLARGYRRENTERYTHNLLMATLRDRFSEGEIAALGRERAAMSEVQAVRIATRR